MNEYESLHNAAKRLRQSYPVGTRVECVSMSDTYSTVPSGTRGTVQFVDDMATLHVAWDNGSGLGLAYGEDQYRKLTQEEIEAESQSENSPDEDSEMTMKM